MPKLLYTGPSINALTEQYAKRGRIDDQAAITLHYETDIDASVKDVWAVLADPIEWPNFFPSIHDVQIDSPVAVGVVFSWKNGKAPLIKSRFAVVEQERELTWVGVSMGAKAVHRHVLESLDSSCTRLVMEESFAGLFLTLLFSKAKAEKALTDWLNAVKVAAEHSDQPPPIS